MKKIDQLLIFLLHHFGGAPYKQITDGGDAVGTKPSGEGKIEFSMLGICRVVPRFRSKNNITNMPRAAKGLGNWADRDGASTAPPTLARGVEHAGQARHGDMSSLSIWEGLSWKIRLVAKAKFRGRRRRNKGSCIPNLTRKLIQSPMQNDQRGYPDFARRTGTVRDFAIKSESQSDRYR
jgi:hypothetical protein